MATKLKKGFQALRNVAGTLAVVCIIAFVVAKTHSQLFYFQHYNFTPGQYLGYRLQQLNNMSADETCLLLGASTAREGFDIVFLEDALPQTNFVTLATTAAGTSPLAVVNIQAHSIPADRYKCIVIALHPFFIRKFDSYELKVSDYRSQLTYASIIRLLNFDGHLSFEDADIIANNLFIPSSKHSGILKKHLQLAVYELRKNVFGLTDSDKRYINRNLTRTNTHIVYSDTRKANQAKYISRRAKRIEDLNQDNPKLYNHRKVLNLFVDMLQRLHSLTDRLIIITLPETPVIQPTTAAAEQYFHSSIRRSEVTAELYRCEMPFDDPYRGYVDSIHVDSEGRKLLTSSLLSILQRATSSGICQR